jgi:hypothetical protein
MAEEYELGTVGPIPTVNPNVAKIGEMLKYAKKYADQYYVKDYVPLLGGMTLGDFLLGKAPEEVERWGQGDSPFRNPATVVGTGGNRLDVFKAGRFEPLLDVGLNVALPAVGTAQMVSKPIVRTLGPKAAEMAEDYLTKQGAIANIVEPSPKKVVEPFSAIDELGFHSPLENAILKIQQPKGTGEQFLKQLEKTPGVKTEELDVTGIKQYLLDNPTVTKQELLDQMATSRLKLQQTVLGKGSDENTYGDYQLRGGEVFDDDDYISSLADDFHYDLKNDDVIRKQERDALLESDPDRYADYQTNPYTQARLEEDIDGSLYELAKSQANDMYYENPMRHYYDEHGYDIYGNDDIGYSVKDPRGNFVRDLGEHYDIDEVQNALATRLADEGILDYEGAGGAKFEDYTLPGNYDNYREVLTTLPDKQPNLSSRIKFKNDEEADNFLTDMSAEGYENMDYGRLNDSTTVEFRGSIPSNIQELIRRNHGDITAGKEYAGKSFQSSHFDEPNILAHTRLDDRIIDGKKTLFVEEIQSDWHQAGRRKGYDTPEVRQNIEKERQRLLEQKDYYAKLAEPYAAQGKDSPPDVIAGWTQAANGLQELQKVENNMSKAVPDAPYKKNWHELMMKQIFNEAVKGNYDAVAFTTGKQQADRYSLSKQISKINFTEAGVLRAYDKNGNMVISKKLDSPDQIEEYIGKEPAKKLMEQELKPTYIGEKESGEKIAHGNPNVFDARELTGVDLDVGGEGMKGFYDKILPDYINKYGKKYGIAVKKANLNSDNLRADLSDEELATGLEKIGMNSEKFYQLPISERSPIYQRISKEFYPKGKDEVHFFDLSDMAKKDIKEKGQPLFSGIGLAPAPLLMDDED